MKAKTISVNSSILLENLLRGQKTFFTIKDAESVLPGITPEAIRKQLSYMVKKGLLLRVTGGLYNIIPFENDSKEYFPNWHQLAGALAQPNEYYIGFYSAMDIHGLVTQPSMLEQIVTKKRVLPKKRQIKKVRFEFITLNDKHFFGYKKHWIDDFSQIYCSDLEKTLVDCLYKPNYAGGITEIVKAIYKSKDKIDIKKLEEYSTRFKAQVVIKRLGFILEKLQIFPELRERLIGGLTDAYAPLDPSLPKRGQTNSQWKIIDNLNIEYSLKAIET